MSKTLFWYLLKDLLRIFLLASGTLAGIMSFGALIRPLTQHGLDASQIGKILSYFSPAMTFAYPGRRERVERAFESAAVPAVGLAP